MAAPSLNTAQACAVPILDSCRKIAFALTISM